MLWQEVNVMFKRIFVFFFLGIMMIYVLATFFSAHRGINTLTMADPALVSEIIEVNIPLHSSTSKVASILYEKGIIKNPFLFCLYARYKGYDHKLQAGKYFFTAGMSADELLTQLQKGVVYLGGKRFTIPEGFTLEQIAVCLQQEGLVNKEDFLQACRDFKPDNLYPFLEEVPSEVNYLLEGYLFPDTYEVREDVTPEDLILMMLHRFDEIFNENYRQRAEELGFTMHEITTLASIVEKEARVAEERPVIAAVFHNRLRSKNMPLLQSCATVQYAIGETKPFLTGADLKIDSPYNTYSHPKLPPGPIASPGKPALEAALYPADVDYLYFVYKEDGTGTHYFSTTLQEHNNYKKLIRSQR
jgi:UPF0755 protein